MNRQHNSKLSLFLMELIMAIMFFSLAAAVCVRLFPSAHLMAEKTEGLSNAVIWSQNLSEAFTGSGGDFEKITALFPNSYVVTEPDEEPGREGALLMFFDKDWEPLDTGALSDACFEAYIHVNEKDASEVYSDVDYGVAITGKALVGDIRIINIEGVSEDYENVTEDENRLIIKNMVDVYTGKGAQ